MYTLALTSHLQAAIELGLRRYHLAPAMAGAAMTVGGLYSLAGQDGGRAYRAA